MNTTALWEKYERFIKLQAYRYYNRYMDLCILSGVTVDDLVQEGFLALLDAARAWSPDSGCELISFIKFPMMKHFRGLLGIRTSKRDPLNMALSLDAPTKIDDEGSEATIADTLPTIETGFEDVEQSVYTQELHRDLEAAITALDVRQEQVVRGLYYKNGTLSSTSKSLGVNPERVRQIKQKAFNILRRNKKLRAYRADIISHYGFSSSLSHFLSTWASGTEIAVERMERYPLRNYQQRSNIPDISDTLKKSKAWTALSASNLIEMECEVNV